MSAHLREAWGALVEAATSPAIEVRFHLMIADQGLWVVSGWIGKRQVAEVRVWVGSSQVTMQSPLRVHEDYRCQGIAIAMLHAIEDRWGLWIDPDTFTADGAKLWRAWLKVQRIKREGAKDVPIPTVDDIPAEMAALILERYKGERLSVEPDPDDFFEGNPHGGYLIYVHRGEAKLPAGGFHNSAPRRNKRPVWTPTVIQGFNRNEWEYPEDA